jgi:hypothetical protein
MRLRYGRAAIAIVFLLLSAASWPAQPARELDNARALAAAGAVELALEGIERHQPPQRSNPDWTDWELLRFDLLARSERHADVLARMGSHTQAAGDAPLGASLLNGAARAAAALERFADARAFLVRLFIGEASLDQYRVARRIAIEVYLRAGESDAAYLAMLRFRHDFAPLRPDEAEGFAAGLLAAGRADDAAQFLTQLPADSPTAALLRLRAGLMTPAAAAGQARALLDKGAREPAWHLLSAAGKASADPEIELEALERRLDSRVAASAHVESAAALWKAYAAVAQRAANELQLLSGDDAQWTQAAERMRPKRPRIARALLATLAIEARSNAARAQAQLRLLSSLRDAGLERAAWRLLSDSTRLPVAQLDSQVRFELGALAATVGAAAAGVRYWQGLPPMNGMTRKQWQVRNLILLLQAGMNADVARLAREALDAAQPLDAQSVRELRLAAADALELGHAEPARIVFQGLVAHVDDAARIQVLTGLARAHESGGDARAAARAYLLAATSAKDPQGDPAALSAREAAAVNLLRAGLRSDAQSVLEWIARHARVAETRRAAERRLSRL